MSVERQNKPETERGEPIYQVTLKAEVEDEVIEDMSYHLNFSLFGIWLSFYSSIP
jgi:hypothetical protein